MLQKREIDYNGHALPKSFIAAVCAVCVLPFALNLLGVDFGSSIRHFDKNAAAQITDDQVIENMYHTLSGSLLHTLLEWSASCAAIFIVVLSFVHFTITKNAYSPIIGIALFWAGCMDAFHTLAADRLIEATADNRNLIPFTWAICRLFNALIPVSVLSIVFLLNKKKTDSSKRPDRGKLIVVFTTSFVLGLLAYLIIHYCAHSDSLPKTMFPDSVIKRPWDMAPLGIYLVSGVVVYPLLYAKGIRSIFFKALWLGTIPGIATQSHMAFGSIQLFDSHFNIAHFLKIIVYVVPCLGLIFDYVYTYRRQALNSIRLEKMRLELEDKMLELKNSEMEIQQFAYVASHDLQEPLRMVSSYMQLIKKRYVGKLDEDADEFIGYAVDGATRMAALINDLLIFSRVYRFGKPLVRTDSEAAADRAIASLKEVIDESGAKVERGDLPEVVADKKQLVQLFQNLVDNAIKYRSEDPPVIRIDATQNETDCSFAIRDNGIGMDPRYHDRIFAIFKRLHAKEDYSGTGIGLAICKRIIERHKGRIWVESTSGNGSVFHFTLAVAKKESHEKHV